MEDLSWEEKEEGPLREIPSSYASREEMLKGFRGIRRTLWGLGALMGVVGVALMLLATDRSLIVALSSDGHMQVLSRISDPVYQKNFERIVRYFTTGFLSDLTAYDSFEISYRLEKALLVMTPGLRARMKRAILVQNLVETVQKARIHTVIFVKDVTLQKVRSGVWSVAMTGERTTYPYGRGSGQSRGFAVTLLLRRGGPTVFNPYGLWVENYRETPALAGADAKP